MNSSAVTLFRNAVTRIRTGVAAATTQSTNHYTITASYDELLSVRAHNADVFAAVILLPGMTHVCIHWFRKGLRLHDNPALIAALKDCKELYPVFILDPYLHNTQVGINRRRFLIGALKDLDCSLRKLNSRLFVLRGKPEDVFPKLFKEWNVTKLTYEYDTEPYSLNRDEKVTKKFEEKYGIPTPEELGLESTSLGEELFPGGEQEALRRLDEHMKKAAWVCSFEKPQTSPNSLSPSTTVLSPYITFGCLSARTFWWRLTEVVYSPIVFGKKTDKNGRYIKSQCNCHPLDNASCKTWPTINSLEGYTCSCLIENCSSLSQCCGVSVKGGNDRSEWLS
ncbi:hypothetical protein XENOCAPTIV_011309 [Xenoophorus captivus]|uniref:Photolyase/cryptochrome alpha/beta domain-containing protein n=1 Tax=Xenoophorus captivus TaxID=1517983 RepID=A0ABV0SBE0_9TELE